MKARSRIIYEKTIDIARGILSQDATTYLQSAKIATDRFLALPDDEKKVLSCDPTAFKTFTHQTEPIVMKKFFNCRVFVFSFLAIICKKIAQEFRS
jgi:hypothetical protein